MKYCRIKPFEKKMIYFIPALYEDVRQRRIQMKNSIGANFKNEGACWPARSAQRTGGWRGGGVCAAQADGSWYTCCTCIKIPFHEAWLISSLAFEPSLWYRLYALEYTDVQPCYPFL